MTETHMTLIPSVIQRTESGERVFDLYSRLLEDKIVFLTGEVNESSASVLVSQLLYLNSQNHEATIQFYINSPGGSVTDGLSIYDVMQYITAPVATFCLGQAASMGSLLMAAGTPGKRYCLPNSRIMVHQPMGGFKGQATDIAIQAAEMERLKARLYEIYAKHSNLDIAQITELLDRDSYLTPEASIEYGLIDEVLIHAVVPTSKGTGS